MVTAKETTAGNSAIKRWVLMGGWRDALYLKEPNDKVVSASQIGYYCDMLEKIAWVSPVTLQGGHMLTCSTRRTDAQFAAEYRIQFHRPGQGPFYAVSILLTRTQGKVR
jgi:hypothetical protein